MKLLALITGISHFSHYGWNVIDALKIKKTKTGDTNMKPS